MKTFRIGWLAALPLSFVLGCAEIPQEDLAKEELVQSTARALTGEFVFDSTAIATPPPAALPQAPLTSRAFEDAMIQRALIGTTEPFTVTAEMGSRVELDSTTWRYEKDAFDGKVLILRKTPDRLPAPQDEALLQRNSLTRLGNWGIPSAEMGPVNQRRGMVQDMDGTEMAAPVLHRYKTYVLRALNGVRVDGHRAVVTYGVDGAFTRAMVKWPAIASSGHLLRTRLTVADIELRARDALMREGETGGNVRLFWKYVPTQLTTGEVTLTLQVGAQMRSVTRGEETEEPHIVNVDVSAL